MGFNPEEKIIETLVKVDGNDWNSYSLSLLPIHFPSQVNLEGQRLEENIQ